jgi:UDPglucose 6-dehydrogenase
MGTEAYFKRGRENCHPTNASGKSALKKKVGILGLWHLGLVSAAVLADLGYDVTATDADKERVRNLTQGRLPVYEPGLEDLVRRHLRSSRLEFHKDAREAVAGKSTVLLTYDTPVDEEDRTDLTLLDKTLEEVTPFLDLDTLVIVTSQVPVGTCERWQEAVCQRRPEASIDLVYSPENIRLGQAIELFRHPDMIIIGSNAQRAREKAERFYEDFLTEKFYVSWRTAEMAKHALNAFFATSISFGNEIGNLCDVVGADGIQIAQILKHDSRIGKKAQVRPGLGFAGGTLGRDLRGLQNLGKTMRAPTPLVDAVLEINHRQTERVVQIVEDYFSGSLKQKVLSIFGLTYKPGTSTLRRSASLAIMERLHAKGPLLRAHDPKANLSEYSGEQLFDYYSDPYAAVEGSHGIVLLTEWPEYQDLDYGEVKKRMAHPLILDAKNYLDGVQLQKLGFVYLQIGRGQPARVRS